MDNLDESKAPEMMDLMEVSEAVQFDVVKDDKDVDGVHILAKARGPAFFPGAVSGNKVRYPVELWDKILVDEGVLKRLSDRTMYGTIGHDIEDINDEVIRRGELSHIVTKLYVDDEGVGNAEYLVVNTPTGQILNTLLRAGSKLRVSTKAKGALTLPDKDGIKTLKSYYLKRVDFVLTPGFEQALPEVAESLSKIRNTPDPVEESKMEGKEFIDHLTAQNTKLQSQVDESNKTIGELQTKLATAVNEVAAANSQLTAVNESLAAANATVEKYTALGTVEQIDEALTRGAETITSLKTELGEAVDESASDLIDLQAVEEELDKYRALGTVETVEEGMKTLNELIVQKEEEVCESLSKKFKRSPGMIKTMATALGGLDKVDEALRAEAAELGINVDESDDSDGKDKSDDGKDKKSDDGKSDDGKEKTDESNKGKVDESLNRISRISGLMTNTRQVRTNIVSGNVDESQGKKQEDKPSRAASLMSRR